MLSFRSELKGSINASFFISCLILFLLGTSTANASPYKSISPSITRTLSSDPTWLALLHTSNRESHITDPGFLLTKDNFSPEAELKATLDYLYSDDAAICRFPARYFWLRKNLDVPDLEIRGCAGLTEFKKKAPIDNLYLVFASENISQPSSMMGHVLIKISSRHDADIERNHAISFYTNIDGFNLPKILYQNLIAGKKGYFTLSPYAEKLARYSQQENRNVWEYELGADDFHKTLIQYHFYELKQTELKYFFANYNCATLTQFILSIASGSKYKTSSIGLTPIDVVKNAESQHFFKKTTLIASQKWTIRMLADTMSKDTLQQVKISIRNNDVGAIKSLPSMTERYLAFELVRNYLDTAQTLDGKPNKFSSFAAQVDIENNKLESLGLDLTNYKRPTATSADSQFSVGTLHLDKENFVFLNFIPASHSLEDDNREYFGETALTLGETTVAASLETGELVFDSFTLYGVKSLIPHDYFTGGLSGSFQIGAMQQYDAEFKRYTKTYINGALGKTYGVADDVSIYGLFGSGIASADNEFFGALTPEVGIIIREIFDMKSLIQYQYHLTDSIKFPDMATFSFTQSFYIDGNWAFFARAETSRINHRNEERFSLWLKHYF